MPYIPSRKRLPWESKERTGFQQEGRKTDHRYHTVKWRKLRAFVLAHEPTCRECAAKNRTTEATDVDHIVPARQDDSLFWAISNLQPLCSHHHKSKSAKERGGRNG